MTQPSNSVRQLLWQANRSTMFYLYVVKKQNSTALTRQVRLYTSAWTELPLTTFRLKSTLWNNHIVRHEEKNSRKLIEFALHFVLNIRVCKKCTKNNALNFECNERAMDGFGVVASCGCKAGSARTEVPQANRVCFGPLQTYKLL